MSDQKPLDEPFLPTVHKTRTVAATRTGNAWPDSGYAAPGAVFVDTENTYKDHLLFACPGCGKMGSIRATHPKDQGGRSWDIVAGKLTEPEGLTLSPSIHCVGCCGWHGWLKAGIFKSD